MPFPHLISHCFTIIHCSCRSSYTLPISPLHLNQVVSSLERGLTISSWHTTIVPSSHLTLFYHHTLFMPFLVHPANFAPASQPSSEQLRKRSHDLLLAHHHRHGSLCSRR